MLSKEENDRLCRVGPGTPMGEWMRRYWHPVSTAARLAENSVHKVRILGEDLVLYQDLSGKLGLIDSMCPHRGMSMEFCLPQEEGVCCPYHGWQFSRTGECVDMPLEPDSSSLKDKVKITAYPAQEMGGLIWGYLGPDPAPLLPRWELFVQEETFRQIRGATIPCNWLQVMDNRFDPLHTVYLHGHMHHLSLRHQGILGSVPDDGVHGQHRGAFQCLNDRTRKATYERWEHGFKKFSENEKGDVNPRGTIIFPYILYHGGPGQTRQEFQIGVPIDDTTTWHIYYNGIMPGHGVEVPHQDVVPYLDLPLKDENGEYILDCIMQQDLIAWVSQGEITDRSKEQLGSSDAGVIQYRHFLQEQLAVLEAGDEPVSVFRDSGLMEPFLHAPYTSHRAGGKKYSGLRDDANAEDFVPQDMMRFSSNTDRVVDLHEKAQAARLDGEPWGEMPTGAIDRDKPIQKKKLAI